MTAKAEACWDRTEGCCLVDAMKPVRRRGDAPLLVDRTVSEKAFADDVWRGHPEFWGDQWLWRCMVETCQPQEEPWEPLPGTEGRADTWAEALRLGLEHLQQQHAKEGT